MRSRWEHLGLRALIALVFAFGTLLLSVTIALVTLTFTRQNLLQEREESSFVAFAENARRVQNRLNAESDTEAINAALGSLTITRGAFPLVQFDGTWTGNNSLVFNEDNVPSELRTVVEAGNAARMRATVDGAPAIVSGVLLPAADLDAAYYEAVKLDDVENTLSSLGFVVAAAAAATTLLAAGLGAWAARRTLSPLGDVRRAAESLAAGELDTRLEPQADTDLASLSASFNGMARSLEDRIERDARFASEVSHELPRR